MSFTPAYKYISAEVRSTTRNAEARGADEVGIGRDDQVETCK